MAPWSPWDLALVSELVGLRLLCWFQCHLGHHEVAPWSPWDLALVSELVGLRLWCWFQCQLDHSYWLVLLLLSWVVLIYPEEFLFRKQQFLFAFSMFCLISNLPPKSALHFADFFTHAFALHVGFFRNLSLLCFRCSFVHTTIFQLNKAHNLL